MTQTTPRTFSHIGLSVPDLDEADGGYPDRWRRYIRTTTFRDSDMRLGQLRDDIAGLGASLKIPPPTREVIVGASDKIRALFASMSLSAPNGDERLRDKALLAVDLMEASLVNARKKPARS